MHTITKLMLVFVSVMLNVGNIQADDKKAFQEKLDTSIVEGIRLLEAKDYTNFLKTFVDPEQFKKFSESGNIEEFANKFGERKGPQLLEVLKSIKGKEPKLENDGKKATYEIKIEGVSKNTITFVKIEKYWYISN